MFGIDDAILGAVAPSVISGGFSLLGGDDDSSAANTQANIGAQYDFAQNAIKWKVRDAKEAGIHPLAALGANTMSFNPVYVGGSSNKRDRMAQMGQHLGRAVGAVLDKESRELRRIQILQEKQRLENMKLEGVGLRKELSELDFGPPYPGFDAGDDFQKLYGSGVRKSGDVVSQSGVIPEYASRKEHGGFQPKNYPMYKVGKGKYGERWLVKSKAMEEAMEEDLPNNGRWFAREATDHSKGIVYYMAPFSEKAKAWRRFWRKLRDRIFDPLADGFEYRYNHNWNQFFPRKIGREGSRFYDVGKWDIPN